jgi:NAD(P) transhydrogenase subunit alpha
MKVAILKERVRGEHRVAVTPETVKKMVENGIAVFIEKDAGIYSSISNEEYINVGAKVSQVLLEIVADADIVLKVQPSHLSGETDLDELSFMREGAVIIGLLNPYENHTLVKKYAHKNISAVSMELVPRTTRAQTMDVLSSQSNLAGYRAVIDALAEFGRVVPMMMTAAGSIPPAKVLILGAGVAGLQAIATAKRMGAVVSAFDVRAAAKEQVESLGAKFISVDNGQGQFETKGGYATEVTDDYKRRQRELMLGALRAADIVITTALIPGKKAPVLLDDEMVHVMRSGSVVVDLAVAYGGNCTLSVSDQITVTGNGVKIIAPRNIVSKIAADASRLYAKNLYNMIQLMYDKINGGIKLNLDDDIINACLVTNNGAICHPLINKIIMGE